MQPKTKKILLGLLVATIVIGAILATIYFTAIKPNIDKANPNGKRVVERTVDEEGNIIESTINNNSNSTPKTFNWVITEKQYSLDGVSRIAIAVNDKPGHLTEIIVEAGDTVIVNVKNNMRVPTTIHFHGLLQKQTPEMDGVAGVTQCPIMPGQSFTYKFSTGDQIGTFWWHSHFHGQYMDGLRGPFIIKEKNKPANPEVIIQLADWYHDSSDFRQKTVVEKGDTPRIKSALINGAGQFNCAKTTLACVSQPQTVFNVASEIYRMRIINTAGASDYIFSIDNHPLTIIEVDGFAVQPYEVQMLTVYIGQRYSVLVDGRNKQGSHLIRAHIHGGNPTAFSAPELDRNVYATWGYGSSAPLASPAQNNSPSPQSLDALLKPLVVTAPPALKISDLNLIFEFDLSQKQGDTYMKWYPEVSTASMDFKTTKMSMLASQSYRLPLKTPSLFSQIRGTEHPQTSNVINLKKGQVVQMTLIHGVQSHSFHMHGFMFYVMAQGNLQSMSQLPSVTLNTANPIMRDTTIIPGPSNTNGRIGYTIIRFVVDNPGVWLFHCHIETHMAAGLGITFIAGEGISDKIATPVCAV